MSRALFALLIAVAAQEPDASVHPRKFGSPGGVGVTRGWYVWNSYDSETGRAEVSNESTGEKYAVRVLPWMTTYRHLAYGAHPDDLLPGERVNLFFNPDGAVKRAWLVHYQDEIGQMKGHDHAWQVDEVAPGGRGFTARVMHGEKEFDPKPGTFELDPSCQIWRQGKRVEDPAPAKGGRYYMTWCYQKDRRVVKLLADGASLDALQAESRRKIQARTARDGMGAFVEGVEEGKARLLIFSTSWAQAGALKDGQTIRLRVGDDGVDVRIVSRRNLGAYGSGPNEIVLDDVTPAKAELLRRWLNGTVVRVFVRE